jgi:hypothetical protein
MLQKKGAINGKCLSEKVAEKNYFGDMDVGGKLTLNRSYSMALQAFL